MALVKTYCKGHGFWGAIVTSTSPTFITCQCCLKEKSTAYQIEVFNQPIFRTDSQGKLQNVGTRREQSVSICEPCLIGARYIIDSELFD